MKWSKRGRIFDPRDRYPFMRHYAQVPTPMRISRDVLRIYFTTRPRAHDDGRFISRTAYIDVQAHDPSQIIDIAAQPSFDCGNAGTFDEFGVMPGFVQYDQQGQKVELWYTGWTRMESVPFCTRIGKAFSNDGGKTFQRYNDGPFLGLENSDPFLINGPFYMYDNGRHHLWYASGREWLWSGERYEIVYQIKHALSNDGVHWEREREFCIPTRLENEAQNRPTVIRYGGRYHMWYCYRPALDFRKGRGVGYRLAHAVSDNLRTWILEHESEGLELSDSGWDSEMMAYPYVLEVDGKIYLFYNGNYFGKEGFGYAELTGE